MDHILKWIKNRGETKMNANVKEAITLKLIYEGMGFSEAAKLGGISRQKATSLYKTHFGDVTDSFINQSVKTIHKNYLLTKDGNLFSMLTNTWIAPTNSCVRMQVNGIRIKKSTAALVKKYFK